MWPPSLVREHCVRATLPQLKLEIQKYLGAVFWETAPSISISIFEASRMNALALIFLQELPV